MLRLLGVWVCWASLLLTALRRARRFTGEAFGVACVEVEGVTAVLAEIFLN